MSTALTDLLIELSDPLKRKFFFADRQSFISKYQLSGEEIAALENRDRLHLRRLARAIPDRERDNTYSQFSRYDDRRISYDVAVAVDIHELHVEVGQHEIGVVDVSDTQTFAEKEVIFIADDGTKFKAKSKGK
jgi:hypothetical protein